MHAFTEWSYDGDHGSRAARTWRGGAPRYVALLCHGYGEHIGRYAHVAERLLGHGAVVHGVDHMGHGQSDGERVLVTDFEELVDDFNMLDESARAQDPGVPVVLIGHSMGGMIAARYAQRYGETLAALVLSGPVLGRWAALSMLDLDEIPDAPIDLATLSRDPAVGEAYAADPLVWHGAFKRPTLEALGTCLDAIDRAGPLRDLPTLWLHGAEDQLVPVEGTRAGIDRLKGPNFSEIVYPGARHEIFNETNQEQVLSDVTAFVDDQLGPR
jgi:alpha-beta hydrolase superfamily lysophospholipase